MKRIAILVLCGLILGGVGAWAANDPKDEAAVKATMDAMAKGMIAKDYAALGKIYGDDLTYSHSSALTETKAELLKSLSGPSVYESMKFSDTTIRIYGDVALFKGTTDLRNGQPGKFNDNHLNILWVLVRRPISPTGWQIVARQTTRYPAPTPAPTAAAR
jgi:ketosteroid isomerase-like protein